jgi:hypothetical protein
MTTSHGSPGTMRGWLGSVGQLLVEVASRNPLIFLVPTARPWRPVPQSGHRHRRADQ